jgi:outer membrane protein assembly factor BamB/pectate lyase
MLLLILAGFICVYVPSATANDDIWPYLLRGGLFEERAGFGRNVTGGFGGSVYHVTTLADSGPGSLREAAQSSSSLWIVFDVSGTITLTSQISVKSNKTIDGRGAKITITGYGLKISSVSNVIVTDIVFDNGAEDAISIRSGANNIWVHHCEFSRWVDGCIDITGMATDVTVSWCRFHHHDKTMLIGSDPDAYGDAVIRVTLHHNFFDGTNSRHPRLRFGKVDAYNNYLYHWGGYGMASLMYGQLLVEANIFEAGSDKDAVLTNHTNPSFTGGDKADGYAKLVDNLLLNGAVAQENEPEKVFNRTDYYTATIEPADNTLKEKIVAGVGLRRNKGVTNYPWTNFHHDLNNTGYTESLAPRTNITLWQNPLGPIESSPAVVNGIVYVGATSNHSMYALKMITGEVLWCYVTGDDVYSAPAVDADKDLIFFCSNDGHIYCLDACTGLHIWNQTTYDPANPGAPIKLERIHPAIHNGIVFYGGYDRNVTARNMTTGELIWNYQTEGTVVGCPAVVDGIVYIGSTDNKTYALNETTGGLIWNYTTYGEIRGSPAVSGGLVFVMSNDGNVYALNASTGQKIWNYTTVEGKTYSSPAVAYGLVYIGSMDSNVYALNMTTGEKVWNYTTGGPIEYASPAVADGLVFIGSNDGKFHCLNASTGELVWSYNTGGEVRGAPAVADGFVFVGSWSGNMYAFGKLPQAPTASFTFSPANPAPSEVITFNASASQPGWNVTESPIISYRWSFGDLNVTVIGDDELPTPTITHSYVSEGDYTVSLTVTDAKGAVSTITNKVPVWHIYDISILSIAASPTTVKVGESVNIAVVAKNNGTKTESFNVTAYYDSIIIDTKIVSLAPKENATLSFTWDTTNASVGNWTIKAVASALPRETNTADNEYTTTVVVIEPQNTWIIYAVIGTVTAAAVAILIYVLKIRKPHPKSQQRKSD